MDDVHTFKHKYMLASQGFSVKENLWTEREVIFARELVGGLVTRYRSGVQKVVSSGISIASVTRQHPDRNSGVLPELWENEPYLIGDLIALDQRFATLFSALKIWQCAADLLECTLEEVVFHLSNITRKPAHIGPAIGWHRDAENTYHATEDGRTIRLLLPLQPMDSNNGGTAIYPYSHFERMEHLTQGAASIVVPSVKPGSGLALHANVLHGGAVNRGDTDRDVIILQFGTASSELLYSGNELLAMSGRDDFILYR
jgi:hypothetical protein